MVNTFRLRAKRTTGSGPPAGLLFGELAYSDADEELHVGRADPTAPPAKIGGNRTDYGPAIADLEQGLTEAGESFALFQLNQLTQAGEIADLNTSQGTQDTAIAAAAAGVASLTTSQGTQDTAIAAAAAGVASLTTSQGTQDTAIAAAAAGVASLTTSQGTQDTAIAALNTGLAAINTGWNYIGPTEPASPAIGFTWWEKVSGVTSGKWEWSGSLWLGELISRNAGATTYLNLTAATSGQLRINLPFDRRKVLIISSVLSGRRTTGVLNAGNFYTATVRAIGDDGSLSTILSSTANLAVDTLNVVAPINAFLTIPSVQSGLAVDFSMTGTPGAVRIDHTIFYRVAR
jgi:hypothetical protein